MTDISHFLTSISQLARKSATNFSLNLERLALISKQRRLNLKAEEAKPQSSWFWSARLMQASQQAKTWSNSNDVNSVYKNAQQLTLAITRSSSTSREDFLQLKILLFLSFLWQATQMSLPWDEQFPTKQRRGVCVLLGNKSLVERPGREFSMSMQFPKFETQNYN